MVCEGRDGDVSCACTLGDGCVMCAAYVPCRSSSRCAPAGGSAIHVSEGEPYDLRQTATTHTSKETTPSNQSNVSKIKKAHTTHPSLPRHALKLLSFPMNLCAEKTRTPPSQPFISSSTRRAASSCWGTSINPGDRAVVICFVHIYVCERCFYA